MRETFRFVTIVGRAAVLLTLGLFVTSLIAAPHLPPSKINGLSGALMAIPVFGIPLGLAAWWMFRKLQSCYSRREARAVSITFAAFAPVPLAIGFVLGTLVGGYTGVILRTQSRSVAFAGTVVGLLVMVAVIALIPSAIALSITRRIIKIEQSEVQQGQ
jgi:hypothetical protein